MRVKVRFFARCREIVGKKEEVLELADGTKVQGVLDLLTTVYPELKKARILISLNHAYTDSNTVLNANDEVAVFTPVSGG